METTYHISVSARHLLRIATERTDYADFITFEGPKSELIATLKKMAQEGRSITFGDCDNQDEHGRCLGHEA